MRPVLTPLVFNLFLYGSSVLACSGREPVAPPALEPPRHALAAEAATSQDCSTQIIYEEPCQSDSGPESGTVVGEIEVTASVEWQDSFASLSADANASLCPPAIYQTSVRGMVKSTNPVRYFDILSSGTWRLWQALGPAHGNYSWPAGRWPATDGSGWSASIDNATGFCQFWVNLPRREAGVTVSFYAFDGVRTYGPGSPASSGGGSSGGGSTGGGTTCNHEYVLIEVSYDGGQTWSVWWEGWATVCE